jgi:hypothetical protein
MPQFVFEIKAAARMGGVRGLAHLALDRGDGD